MAKELKYIPLSHPMRNIDVDGLPEPVAMALNTVVQTLRRQLATSAHGRRPPKMLLRRPGTVIRDVSRDDVHGNVR